MKSEPTLIQQGVCVSNVEGQKREEEGPIEGGRDKDGGGEGRGGQGEGENGGCGEREGGVGSEGRENIENRSAQELSEDLENDLCQLWDVSMNEARYACIHSSSTDV